MLLKYVSFYHGCLIKLLAVDYAHAVTAFKDCHKQIIYPLLILIILP